MLTDLQNSFVVGFRTKYSRRHLLYFPPQLKRITTLPCETSAVDTFDFQQITMDVRKCVQVRG